MEMSWRYGEMDENAAIEATKYGIQSLASCKPALVSAVDLVVHWNVCPRYKSKKIKAWFKRQVVVVYHSKLS